jgi:hypothetical protein
MKNAAAENVVGRLTNAAVKAAKLPCYSIRAAITKGGPMNDAIDPPIKNSSIGRKASTFTFSVYRSAIPNPVCRSRQHHPRIQKCVATLYKGDPSQADA